MALLSAVAYKRLIDSRPSLLAVAGACCALLVAGCGGSSSGTGTGASARPSLGAFLAYAKCMRTHGVPNFPDLGGGGNGPPVQVTATPGNTSVTINGAKVSGPAFQSAQHACQSLLPRASGPAPKLTPAMRARVLNFAKCMRAHGVHDFPDPTFGQGFVRIGGPGINPSSPVFQHARQACGGPLGQAKAP